VLPEGFNKDRLCRFLKIDKDDFLGLLLAVAQCDTIDALTILPVNA
jgi:HipA-like protein